jgi:poly-beta-1,6-N-acetyl-D-glucosamine biosynthesis protein PgaD
MEKPGPGTRPPRPLIIERPDLQSPLQRVVSTVLTTAFWVLWTYLWLPVLALLGWWLGISRFYEEMVRLEGYRPLVGLLGWYAACIALLAGSLIAWALYNLWRFRGRERRRAPASLGTFVLAEHLGVNAEDLLAWQRARILYVTHDDDGEIASVELPVAAASAASRAVCGPETDGPETLLREPATA